jgi:CheY-like chemotaxis protein
MKMTVSAARRVLVVDDDRDCADTIAMVLRRFGAEIAVAYTGETAVALFDSFAPDLVFLDIGMPKMDGYATIAALRARPSGVEVEIVALTGWGREEDRDRTTAAGFDRHLIKPVEASQLRDLLDSRGRFCE